MQINPIQNNKYNSNSVNFKHWERTVYKSGTTHGIENVVRRNTTFFFREPAFWKYFTDFLDERFKNVPKINLYSYGCSDGSDPLTLIMKLIGDKSENVLKKISPIIAKDIDPVAISKAKSAKYMMTLFEQSDINYWTNDNYNLFFKESKARPTLEYDAEVEVKPELLEYIQYDVANVLEDYKNIEPNNSIVLLRNVLPYLTKTEGEPYWKDSNWNVQKDFLENLYNHLGKNSYIAIGEYDRFDIKNIEKILFKSGFKKTSIHNLYRKMTEEEKKNSSKFLTKVAMFFQILFE